jgi:hypothetical protein
MNSDLQPIQEKIQRLIGQRPWEVKLGWGSFITLEFGKQIEVEGIRGVTYIHGEWHLWVQMSAWRLETKAEVITASEDSREGMSRGIKQLEGTKLLLIKLRPPALETILMFEGGLILRLFPIYSEELTMDDWALFCPDGYVLTVGSGQWSYHLSSEP